MRRFYHEVYSFRRCSSGVKHASYPWSEERKQEVWDSFRNIINICNEDNIDLLLISETFSQTTISKKIKKANYIFSRLKETKVVIIAGNHDYISPRSNYIKFEWCDKVHMLINEHVDSVYFEDINTEVYGFSYHQREIKEPLLDNVKIQHEDRINILLAHAGGPTNIPFDLNLLESKGFDYIALGHIHKPEILGRRIAYAGSIEPIDKTDIGRRGYIAGEIKKDKETQEESHIEFYLKGHSHRQYINIEVKLMII